MTNILNEQTKQNAKINFEIRYINTVEHCETNDLWFKNIYIREIPRENVLTCKVIIDMLLMLIPSVYSVH